MSYKEATIYFESTDTIPTRQVTHLDDRWVCSLNEYDEEIGMLLTDQPLVPSCGRWGKGSIFGAFVPATGEALTAPYPGRTFANLVNFLEQVEFWIPWEAAQVYGILDNLNVHRATDVLLFSLAHPRWEFVFQPRYAGYLNVIEPW